MRTLTERLSNIGVQPTAAGGILSCRGCCPALARSAKAGVDCELLIADR